MELNTFNVSGKFSKDDIMTALQNYFKDRSIKYSSPTESRDRLESFDYNKEDHLYKNEIVVSELGSFEHLKNELDSTKKKLTECELSSSKALNSIQSFNKQQQALFDEFVLLRQKYDEQKSTLINVLWNTCSQYHPELRQIPVVENDEFVENESKVGSYNLGTVLGEGQFATVRVCRKEGESFDKAIKIIKKEKITSFLSLKRMSNEIQTLRKLKSDYIVSVYDVIHTSTKLYILTEMGGADLFEFFDEHPNGVNEKWAKEIISNILKAVSYCHDHFYCHRDLKPEVKIFINYIVKND